jgi:menaquinone-9 beta-reductase
LIPTKVEVAVIGGGLAGLVAATFLSKRGAEVLLIEKKSFPFHRVCGEYISNEAVGFLSREGLLPNRTDLPQLFNFELSDTLGNTARIPLGLGGFGVSRYLLDDWMCQKAKDSGVQVLTSTQVNEVRYIQREDFFELTLSDSSIVHARFVIGAYGKRSKLDKFLQREFIERRSPYLGVKYHIKTDYLRDTVALYNFQGGYCGLNAIEEGKFNLCYLGDREQLRKYGSIEAMEESVLLKNPILKRIWDESEFLFEKPEVISEINFEPKKPVENHILMAGDSAGLITPLCGNGMAMAIHAGKLAAEAIIQGNSRVETENLYQSAWKEKFERRLWVGRQAQLLFGSGKSSGVAYQLIKKAPGLASWIIRQTHGKPF